jgi:hypothetical protein
MSPIPLVRSLYWWSLILIIEIVGGTVLAQPVQAQEYSLGNLLPGADLLKLEMLPQLDDREPIGLPEGLALRVEPRVQESQSVKVSPPPASLSLRSQSVVVAPPPATPAPTDLNQWFEQYGQTYRVDPRTLQAIARCESGFNPGANNGPYGGLFQFHAGTWQTNRAAMGLDTNPQLRFQPEEAVKTAAFKISRDGTGAWPVCSRQG